MPRPTIRIRQVIRVSVCCHVSFYCLASGMCCILVCNEAEDVGGCIDWAITFLFSTHHYSLVKWIFKSLSVNLGVSLSSHENCSNIA